MEKRYVLVLLLFAVATTVTACTSKEQQVVQDAMEKDAAVVGDDVTAEKTDDAAMTDEVDDQGSTSDSSVSFSGTVLAGSSSPLLEYNDADYQQALASDRVVLLYFYADWCPICRAEFPKMQAAFNQLTGDEVVGFRVNYNDNETTDAERDLAREFGVAYQHTKVALKNGERVLKAPDSWDTDRYLEEINTLTK